MRYLFLLRAERAEPAAAPFATTGDGDASRDSSGDGCALDLAFLAGGAAAAAAAAAFFKSVAAVWDQCRHGVKHPQQKERRTKTNPRCIASRLLEHSTFAIK